MNALQLWGALELGLIYALVALGVYLTFRVINFADLTVDGSLTLGAAVAAAMIAAGHNPILATSVATGAGAVAGAVTGYLHVRLDILGLLASILTMTALYSINLRIMGQPNIALLSEPTVFTDRSVILVLSMITIVTVVMLALFFASHLGLAARAVGINPRGASAYGIGINGMKILVIALSNGLVALAGALFAESQGFADVSLGAGTIIVGLAAVIIGEVILKPKTCFVAILACLGGSIFYRIVLALALNSQWTGLKASDLNLITSGLVVATMAAVKFRKARG